MLCVIPWWILSIDKVPPPLNPAHPVFHKLGGGRCVSLRSVPCLCSMAVEFPLVLYDCKFENIPWVYDREVQEFNVAHLQQQWADQAVKTHLLYSMLQGLDSVAVPCGTGTTGTSADEITYRTASYRVLGR